MGDTLLLAAAKVPGRMRASARDIWSARERRRSLQNLSSRSLEKAPRRSKENSRRCNPTSTRSRCGARRGAGCRPPIAEEVAAVQHVEEPAVARDLRLAVGEDAHRDNVGVALGDDGRARRHAAPSAGARAAPSLTFQFRVFVGEHDAVTADVDLGVPEPPFRARRPPCRGRRQTRSRSSRIGYYRLRCRQPLTSGKERPSAASVKTAP